MSFVLKQGGWIQRLREMPDESVHCVITSPPYWGLRNYGVVGQLGLEAHPEEYISKTVEGFREVRRVLRSDGTCWVNMGDCYNQGNKGQSGEMNPSYKQASNRGSLDTRRGVMLGSNRNRNHEGMKPKDLVGLPWMLAFALRQPYAVPTCVKSDIDRAWLAAMFDGEGCIGIRRFDSYRKEKQQVYQDGFVIYVNVTNSDVELLDRCQSLTGVGWQSLKQKAGFIDGRKVCNRRDSYSWRAEGNAAIDVLRAIYPYLVAKRKQAALAYTLDTLNKHGHGSRTVPADVQEKKKRLWELIKACNQRQPVDIPEWVIEPKQLVEPGWYLRSDIIWAKPNPMPESVTDRPTKAHEYIFLLTKSSRYFYDAEAIKEPCTGNAHRRSAAASEYPGDADRDDNRRRPGVNPKCYNGSSFTKGKTAAPRANVGQGDRHTHLMPREKQNPSFSEAVHDLVESRNKRSVWEIPTHPYPEAHFACVDEQTQCLTSKGWKGYREIFSGDTAAQFDLETGVASWGVVEAIARYEVKDEPLVSAVSRDLNLLLTPNHRTIVARRGPIDRKWKKPIIIRADALKPSHGLPVSAPWERATTEPISEEWAELLGWYAAEGYEHPTSCSVEIYQSEAVNSPKVQRIDSLLRSVHAIYSSATAKRVWYGRPADMTAFQVSGFAALRLRELAPDKVIPWTVLCWSDRLLCALLRGLIDGDGHTRRDDGRESLIQKDRRLLDIAQAIGTVLGKATKQSTKDCTNGVLYFTDKRFISLRGAAGEGAKIERQPCTGTVWCPKLPNGTWIARRNGRVFITGNTFPPKLVEPCILAGTSEKGCCPKCGDQWGRIVERIDKGWNGSKYGERAVSASGGALTGGTARSTLGSSSGTLTGETRTTGWQPTCQCIYKTPIPCTVLDPFSGAGTTGVVATRLHRDFIGIELNPEYLEMSKRRIEQDAPLFNTHAIEAPCPK